MTTIAYRDGVLAADSLTTRNDVVTGSTIKVRRLSDGRVAGLLGRMGHAQKLLSWVEAGSEGDPPDGDGALVVAGHAGIICIEDGFVETSSAAPFKAWGSGADIAIGALAAGATAEQAVHIACQWDALTGGDVITLRLTD